MKAVVLFAIHCYQRYLSVFLPPACRFYPSCSHYTAESIQTHGLIKGGWLATRRICRCHPLHTGGYDPVPEKTTK